MVSSAGFVKHFECAVIGDWHLAFCTAACLASTGRRVLLVNPGNAEWREFPKPPVVEPGLPEMLENTRRAGNLEFANGITSAWSADVVWLAIDTPVNENDEPNISPLLEVAEAVAQAGCCKDVFAMNSQVPLGFAKKLEKILAKSPGSDAIAYVPENLRLGNGIETFLRADRTVIGSSSPGAAQRIRQLMEGFKTEFVFCDLPTAEMIKHANNIFLATSISFANELARVGERLGVDNSTVARALKLDRRIGRAAYVEPGLGFHGGTLPRDLRVVQSLGAENKVPTPLVDAVLAVNASTSEAILDSILSYLGPEREGAYALLMGYTYKADTDTLRRSPALELAAMLSAAAVRVFGYDPVMNDKDLSEVERQMKHLKAFSFLEECPDVIVVTTPRPLFVSTPWRELTQKSRRGRKRLPLVMDLRGYLQKDEILSAGLAYKRLWQPVESP